MKRLLIFMFGMTLALFPLAAQTHTSVPVDAPVYRILDKAQMRGLCAPLSGVRPYSRAVILRAVDEILSADSSSLSDAERRILQEAQKEYRNRETDSFDFKSLSFGIGHDAGNTKKIPLYGEIDFDITMSAAGAYSTLDENSAWAGEIRPTAIARGDIGNNLSFMVDLEGIMLRSPRRVLGNYYAYYDGFPEGVPDPGDYPFYPEGTTGPVDYTTDGYKSYNPLLKTQSEPLAYFPYTYRKRWDMWLSPINDVSSGGATAWPDGITLGYTALAELSGSVLDDIISWRFGRVDREWGAMDTGSSLVLNQIAMPFLALEATAYLTDWFKFSTITGVLEFSPDRGGLKVASATFQNAFSASMIEFDYKNSFHFDLGTTSVWAKRFELGYLFPLIDNYFYQNNIGDNDNLALFASIRYQKPGLFKVWFSGFADELNPKEILDLFKKDRMMFALQAGTSWNFPWLPFATVSLRYTKIEPYTYTHTRRNDLPWYGDNYMETNYVNNGRGLGYYLPPNSDELLFRFETQPALSTELHFQYQMIRHGADFGPHPVDGSSYWSELDPSGRSDKQTLRKSFLEDGAYQWQHVLKVGGAYRFAGAPVSLFGEAGVVFSYFTDIDVPASTPYTDWAGRSHSASVVDTSAYPKTTTFIVTLGVKIFP
ncbi:hypothetical protein FACS1894147_07670 [Spirochaetia bacterium]|nr:hypothetical protein FACS1894147_07670 [Spirochaetia bacterium]